VRLIFDARHLSLTYTGLGRYTQAVLEALVAAPTRPDFNLVVLMRPSEGRGTAEKGQWAPRAGVRGPQLEWVDVRPFSAAHYARMSVLVDSLGGDFYFYPHFDVPFGIRTPIIFVVHDLLPLLVEGYVQRYVLAKKAWFKFALRHSLSRAVRCHAVSQTTRRDIIGLVGARYAGKVGVTVEGPLLNVSRTGRPDANPHTRFILYVGDRRPHKNLKRLLDIFRILKSQHDYPGELYLVGARRNYDFDVDAYAAEVPGVVVTGPLPDDQLAPLYCAADALILLSKYEGFGLPVVEAAAMGSRVIVSDGGSLPEIAPRERCLIPAAMRVTEAAASIAHFLSKPCPPVDPAYLARYSWDQAVRSLFPFAFADSPKRVAT